MKKNTNNTYVYFANKEILNCKIYVMRNCFKYKEVKQNNTITYKDLSNLYKMLFVQKNMVLVKMFYKIIIAQVKCTFIIEKLNKFC